VFDFVSRKIVMICLTRTIKHSLFTYHSFSLSVLLGSKLSSVLRLLCLHLGLSLLLLRDLLGVELVGELLSVHSGADKQHGADHANGASEEDQVVGGGGRSGINTKLKVGPPVESLEDVEEDEHAHDLHPVLPGVLVHLLVVTRVGSEVRRCLLTLGEVLLVDH